MAIVKFPGPSMPVDLSLVIVTKIIAYMSGGGYYVFEASETDMLSSGLIFDESIIPSQKVRSCRCGHYHEKCSRLGDGRLRLHMNVQMVMTHDQAFQRFMGRVLEPVNLD